MLSVTLNSALLTRPAIAAVIELEDSDVVGTDAPATDPVPRSTKGEVAPGGVEVVGDVVPEDAWAAEGAGAGEGDGADVDAAAGVGTGVEEGVELGLEVDAEEGGTD